MDGKARCKKLSPADQAAKRGFLLLGLHAAAFLESLQSDREDMWLRIALLAVYAVCMLALDRALWRLNSRSTARFMCRYWLAASLCTGVWMLWGEHWLSSSGNIFKILVCFAAVPYVSIFSVSYQGWPWHNNGFCSTVGAVVLLTWCLAHLAAYGYLRHNGSEE